MPDPVPHSPTAPHIVIACGGTGGHLFPGVAVGQELLRRGCRVTLMVSPKDVDQQAIQSITGMGIVTLPAVGLTLSTIFKFARGFLTSYRVSKACFTQRPPQWVLAMGGFTSAGPILAGRRCGAKTFLHESNSIPGRATRWLSRLVDGVFVYFPTAAASVRAQRVETAGMPVRPPFFEPRSQADARIAMGLDPNASVVLVMGGSQGAHKVNELACAAAVLLRETVPGVQFIHLTGTKDAETVRRHYQAMQIPAVVHAFWNDMATALAAADVAVSRSGASSLAELAASQLPAVLIPYPTAADNHQFYNASAFVSCGAARLLAQNESTPAQLAEELAGLLRDSGQRAAMKRALESWRRPRAASDIADRILNWPETAAAEPGRDNSLKSQKLGTLNV